MIILYGFIGTAIKGDWSTEAKPEEVEGVIDRCLAIVPELGSKARVKAEISHVWVGLRPGRKEVRLEIDLKTYSVPVAHNYGHGGSGWTLHWGCAKELGGLVIDHFYGKKKAKL